MGFVVTIDGPAGAGKSTVAKALARELGFAYLDTGAMYRALTLKGMRRGVDWEDEEALVRLAAGTRVALASAGPSPVVRLDGEDVTEAIRMPEVTAKTFYVARAPRVREILVAWQRRMGEDADIVVEGRDAGTVIFPRAAIKFYLDAEPDERRRRRLEELRAKGVEVDPERLRREMEERDRKDRNRPVGPLRRAGDAIPVDSTRMPVEEVVAFMAAQVRERLTGRARDGETARR